MSNPPNAASVAIFNADSVLLIKRALSPYQHCWTLPGGRLEPGEAALDCAIREVREELSLSIAELVPVTVQTSGNWRLQVFVTFTPSEALQPSEEIADWMWIVPDDVSDLKTTPDLQHILKTAWICLNTV